MAYITPDYYTNEYKGVDAGKDLEKFIERASDVIDQLTNDVLFGKDVETIAEYLQIKVRKATAAQVEFYVLSGSSEEVDTGKDTFTNVSIGSFAYGAGSSQGGSESRDVDRVSPSTLSLLRSTGLLYQGLDVVYRG